MATLLAEPAGNGRADEWDDRAPLLRALLHVLLRTEAIQRPALARALGIRRHAVSDLVAVLEARGLVQVTGSIDGRPGRSTHSYRLNERAALAFAAAAEGGTLHVALMDLRGTVIAETSAAWTQDGTEDAVRGLAALARRLCTEAGSQMFRLRVAVLALPPGGSHQALLVRLEAAVGCRVAMEETEPATFDGALEKARAALLTAIVDEIGGNVGW
jgi:DNA-binding MarR family transcriptional regulator